jgi:hypothetical protein
LKAKLSLAAKSEVYFSREEGEVAICNLLVAFDAQRRKNLFEENTLTKRTLKLVRLLGEILLNFYEN